MAALLKLTPNLTKLTLEFSGSLHTGGDTIGPPLLEALCNLKELEEFRQNATNSTWTCFGQYTLMRLVSSWPKLRILYVAGDSNGETKECESLPPATCALESVTFERCMADFELFAPMFAGSAHSLEHLKSWSMGFKEIDAILEPVLPSIRTLTLGGASHPTPSFIINKLAHAPRLSSISLGGDNDHFGYARKAFTIALADETKFQSLRELDYPAQDGTFKTGRGRSHRVHEYDNVGEEELVKAAHARGVRVARARELVYKVEGAQRRKVYAIMGRRRW